MAENKGITEVKALTVALGFVPETEEEVRKKIEHMIEVRGRRRERKTGDIKRLANIALGEKFAEAWTGEEFKCADVRDFLEVSSSKANAVIRAMGWEQVESTEKVKVYKL